MRRRARDEAPARSIIATPPPNSLLEAPLPNIRTLGSAKDAPALPSLLAVIERDPIGKLVLDRDGDTLYANPAALRVLGLRADAAAHRLGEALPTRVGEQVDVESLAGRRIEIELLDDALDWGGARCALLSIRDVTDVRRLEAFKAGQATILEKVATGAPLSEVLRLAAELIERMHPQSRCSVLLLDHDGITLRHGASPSLPPAYSAAIDGERAGPAVGSCGTAVHLRRRVVVADIENDPLWANYKALALSHGLRACWSQPIFSGSGAILGTFAVYSDSPREPAAEELESLDACSHLVGVAIERARHDSERNALLAKERTAREQLDAAQRLSGTGSWEYVPPHGPLAWSAEVYRICGVDPATFVASREALMALVHPDDRARLAAAQKRTFVERTGQDVEYRIVRPDGGVRHLHERAQLTFDARGEPVSVAGTVQDVTERKDAQRELEMARARLMDAINAIPGSFRLFDKDERLVLANDFRWPDETRVIEIKPGVTFEWLVDEAIAKGLHSEAAEDPAAWRARRLAQFRRADTDAEMRWAKDRWHHLLERRTSDGGVLSLRFDVTERKRVEQALRESKERMEELASLLHKAQDGIIVRGLDHVVSFWSAGAERMYGWTASEAVGKTIPELIYRDPKLYGHVDATLMRDGEWSGMVEQRRKDGAPLMVENRLTLVRDDVGSPKAVLGINTDITKRHGLELQLDQARRLDAMGKLTGGVAHDFNNLLTVILGHVDLLLSDASSDAAMRSSMEAIEHAATRAAELTSHLLAFARRQALRPSDTDVNAPVVTTAKLLRRTLGEHIEVDCALDSSLRLANVDPAQLETALVNLCVNARDAMPDGGRILIETANARLDDEYASAVDGLRPGLYVTLAVTDTGVGIPRDVIDKVFEPFFTTKEVGKGTGLGLSMVYGFAKQSNGHVTISSEPGAGTTVRLYLPPSAAAEASAVETAAGEALPTGSERILLVEDDPQLRSMAGGQLRSLGYDVSLASNGPEALGLLEGGSFALVLTDVVMPGAVNGKQLADAVAARWPATRVLFMSGYSEDAIVHHGRLDPGVRLLAKPFRKRDLAAAVRIAIDSPT